MDTLKGGAQFGEVAADFSEDPQSALRGGDLGFIPASVVQRYPPQLRDAVLKAKPGEAKAIGDGNGFVIVLVLGKDTAGQKDLGTPGVKEAITQSLKTRREQVLRSAYITSLRNGAVIENLIARRVVESQGKVPRSVRPRRQRNEGVRGALEHDSAAERRENGQRAPGFLLQPRLVRGGVVLERGLVAARVLSVEDVDHFHVELDAVLPPGRTEGDRMSARANSGRRPEFRSPTLPGSVVQTSRPFGSYRGT